MTGLTIYFQKYLKTFTQCNVVKTTLMWITEQEKAAQEAEIKRTTAAEEESDPYTAGESETTATEEGSEDVFDEEDQIQLFRKKKAQYTTGQHL